MVFTLNDINPKLFFGGGVKTSDVNKANSVKAKARQYKAKARGLQGQGLTLQRLIKVVNLQTTA